MNPLELLLNMTKNSVYGLINETKKEVYLSYSSDTMNSLVRLINENRNGLRSNIEINQFEYKVFEEVSDKKELKLRFNYWYDKLNVNGYRIINKKRPVIYKLVVSIERHFNDSNKKLLYVKLKNRYSEMVVGVFNNITDCNDFITNYGDLYSIKYSSNSLTKDYISDI